MGKKNKTTTPNSKEDQSKEASRSASFFDREVRVDADVIAASWAVCGDLANGRFSAGVGNAIGRNVGNMLKIVELKAKYGRGKTLHLPGPIG